MLALYANGRACQHCIFQSICGCVRVPYALVLLQIRNLFQATTNKRFSYKRGKETACTLCRIFCYRTYCIYVLSVSAKRYKHYPLHVVAHKILSAIWLHWRQSTIMVFDFAICRKDCFQLHTHNTQSVVDWLHSHYSIPNVLIQHRTARVCSKHIRRTLLLCVRLLYKKDTGEMVYRSALHHNFCAFATI